MRRFSIKLCMFTLCALCVGAILTRLACDTVESRWQQWCGLPADSLLSQRQLEARQATRFEEPRSSTVVFRPLSHPIASLQDYKHMLDDRRTLLDEWWRPTFSTDAEHYSLKVVGSLRLVLYGDERLFPAMYFLRLVLLVGASSFAGAGLAHRIAIERAGKRALRKSTLQAQQASALLSTRFSPVWSWPLALLAACASCAALPAAGLVAWYVAFDRTGLFVAYGSVPYSRPLWNSIVSMLVCLVSLIVYRHLAVSKGDQAEKCLFCSYNLTGLTNTLCPECGKPFGSLGLAWGAWTLRALASALCMLILATSMAGMQRTVGWDQDSVQGCPVLRASFTDRFVAWVLMAPAAPVEWRGTYLGSIFRDGPSYSNE